MLNAPIFSSVSNPKVLDSNIQHHYEVEFLEAIQISFLKMMGYQHAMRLGRTSYLVQIAGRLK